MKYFMLSICICCSFIFLSSCEKNNLHNGSIIGNWELREVHPSMAPAVNYPAGNGSRYYFTASSYSHFNSNVLIKTGHYKILADTTASETVGLTIVSGEFTRRIIFDNDESKGKIFFEISDDKLNFLSGYYPLDAGLSEKYEKQ